MIAAITMNYVEEAIGIVRAAVEAKIPVAVSFTTETDGRLPTGQTLKEAIVAVDRATGGAPAYFMINCAHPTHFAGALGRDESWITRIRGLRANASKRSHAELDASTDLDAGNPAELGREYRRLLQMHPQINVLGGCCGTDHRHVEAIAGSCLGHAKRAFAA
jgi:homocysteine S-methyltransferase